jgi:hypothetical protein
MRSTPDDRRAKPSDLTAWLWVFAIGMLAGWLALFMLLRR